MALLKENINNFIVDDLDKRNQNWTAIDDSLELIDDNLELKADKTYVDNQDALKADKTYVDNQDALKADITYVDNQDALKADKAYVDNKVQTDVPSGAKFTDTVTTINDKTGTITKEDITALGIPAQDTVVDISGKADKTYVDDKVKTDVPSGAKFTDTVYSHPASHPASMITESSTKRFVSDVEKDNWDNKAETSDIPTKVSQLQNDSNYITQSELGDAGGGDMTKGVYDTNNNGIVDNAEKVNGFTVGTNVPSNAKFTDTKVVTSPTEPSLETGDQWHKEI